MGRIWARDGALWSDRPDVAALCADRLGWLDLPQTMREHLPRLRSLAAAALAEGVLDVVLCGMGGSSLAPEVIANVLGRAPGHPRLTVLDSTDPRAVAATTARIDPARSLFLVASKSGGTIETDSLRRHFEAVVERAGVPEPGSRFVAITDEGSALHRLGVENAWREVFVNPSDVGGRYSALSLFGLVPAALLGVDLDALLGGAAAEADTCRPGAAGFPPSALKLGTSIGGLAKHGVDKLTLLAPASLVSFGDWVEQLVAESTGKAGPAGPVGVVPVVGESDAAPLGDDRFIVSLVRPGEPRRSAPDRLPQTSFFLRDARDLGALFWRFEMATALAAVVLGIEPFDQPDVASAKAATNAVLAGEGGAVPAPARGPAALAGVLAAVPAGGYVAILSYLPRDPATDAALRDLAAAAGARSGRPVTVGVGPRYLHSTGQLHKGGPNNGVFVVLEGADPTDTSDDLPVPGRAFSFGRLFTAQLEGDLATLTGRGRTVVRLRAGGDAAADVRAWGQALHDG